MFYGFDWAHHTGHHITSWVYCKYYQLKSIREEKPTINMGEVHYVSVCSNLAWTWTEN
jgi:hypothetical protein